MPRDRRAVALKKALGMAVLSGLVAAAPSAAQEAPTPSGEYLFRTHCASCHGVNAKGDGPLADSMRQRPTDLTEIARRNKGVFPSDEIGRIIDGRTAVKGHGGTMPVWGDVFNRTEGATSAVVRRRIETLVRYLQGLQARTAH